MIIPEEAKPGALNEQNPPRANPLASEAGKSQAFRGSVTTFEKGEEKERTKWWGKRYLMGKTSKKNTFQD